MTDKQIAILQELVAEHGSQAAAARAYGVHPGSLNRWLKGSRPISKYGMRKLGIEKICEVNYTRTK